MGDIFVEVTYPIDNPEKYEINTNIKRDKVKDFLLDVLRAQMGAGADRSKPVDRDVYHIRVECDLEYDNIRVSGDTGNASLSTGILMDVSRMMGG